MSIPFTNDPILSYLKNGTSEPFLQTQETIKVINGSALLSNLPDKMQKVVLTQNGTQNIFEVSSGIPVATTFIVNYQTGLISFSSENEGKQYQASYFSRGVTYFPVTRVWTQENNGNVTETLGDLTTNAQTQADYAKSQGDYAKSQGDLATQAANTANISATNVNSIHDTTIMVWKPYVSTYSAIATTYPTPEIGWTTQCQDTLIRYRYDGTQWVQYEVGSQGYDVFTGSVPPTNTNSLWLDDNSTPTTMKIAVSDTQPTNTNCVWVQPSN